MPVGLVNDDDFSRELEKLSPRSIKKNVVEIIDKPSRGRDDGDNNVPDSLRQIIGEEAVINGRQSALGLAGMFGISSSSVSAYTKGATSTTSYDTPKPSIINHINKSRARASNKAGKVLSRALESITQEKLDYTDAKDLSAIAKDMSVVIKNLEPKDIAPTDANGVNTPQFVIFAPQFRDERSFDVIHVQE